jgi:hypothetical protein
MNKSVHFVFADRFQFLIGVAQFFFCMLVVLVLLPEGSVRAAPLFLLAIPFFVLAAIVAALIPIASRHRSLQLTAVGVSGLLLVWCCLQSVSFIGNPFASPVWKAASDVLGTMAGSISVVPADTLATLVPVLLPFAVFLTSMALFQSDEDATRLLRFLAIFGGLVALYGLIQYELFPDHLMFRKKEYYLRDMTSVLVNRNSIATYLGAALLLNAGFLFDSLMPGASRSGRGGTVFYAHRHIRVSAYSILHGFLLCVAVVALLLTHSRAGTAASFISLLLLAVFFVLDGYRRIERRYGERLPGATHWRRIAVAIAASAAVALVFAFFAGQVILRADLQGMEDGRFCAYPSIVQLLRDNWLLGTGLGSFREAFARYQDPACGKDILWDRAHSFYLEGWIDLGVVFVPVLLLVVLGLLLTFVSGIRRRKARRWASATGAAVLLVFVLHSIVDFSIQIPGVAVYFAAVMAGTAVLSMNRNRAASGTKDASRVIEGRRRGSRT